MNPFHDGERAVQARAGVSERATRLGTRMVRNFLDEQHREFFVQLPFLVVGARDATGRPWASLLCGPPGFVRATSSHLFVDALPLQGDALYGAVHQGSDVGLLGIEPASRRRNRENGVVDERTAGGFSVRVLQSYGNCPAHITPRQIRHAPRKLEARTQLGATGNLLEPSMARLVAEADTFFIATGWGSAHESSELGMDVSHRGGPPGFVAYRDEENALLFVDYPGNNMFNTLGNLENDPRAGLTFVDWKDGRCLQLTGRALVKWRSSGESPQKPSSPGPGRSVSFRIESARWTGPLPLELEDPREESSAR